MKSKIEIFKNIPTMSTERLLLRKINKKDLYDVYEYSKDPELSKFLLWSPHQSLEFTKVYLDRIEKLYKKGSFYDWAITLKENGKMIGTCGFTSIDFDNNSAEIGYVLSCPYHRRGIGSEAVSKVLEFGFYEMCFHRIEAKFMLGNTASEALLKSLGFKFDGIMRDMVKKEGKYHSVAIYSMLQDEYFNLWNNTNQK